MHFTQRRTTREVLVVKEEEFLDLNYRILIIGT